MVQISIHGENRCTLQPTGLLDLSHGFHHGFGVVAQVPLAEPHQQVARGEIGDRPTGIAQPVVGGSWCLLSNLLALKFTRRRGKNKPRMLLRGLFFFSLALRCLHRPDVRALCACHVLPALRNRRAPGLAPVYQM